MVVGNNLRFPAVFSRVVNKIVLKNHAVIHFSPVMKLTDDNIYERKLAEARARLTEMGINDIKPLINLKRRNEGFKRRLG